MYCLSIIEQRLSAWKHHHFQRKTEGKIKTHAHNSELRGISLYAETNFHSWILLPPKLFFLSNVFVSQSNASPVDKDHIIHTFVYFWCC